MHPVLFKLPFFDWPLHTYGVLIVSGFLMAMYVAWREAKRQNQYVDDVLDFAFWALLGGMIGARIVFILVNWKQYFVDQPWDTVFGVSVPAVLVVWKGGLVFYGAALGGFVAFLLYTNARGIYGVEKLRIADMMIVGLPLAAGMGRLGCVAAGCCWGDAAWELDAAGHFHQTIPLAIQFPKGALAYGSMINSETGAVRAAMQAIGATGPLVPIQLIDAIGEVGLFFALLVIRSRKWFHGQVLLSYGLLYPIWRSTLEIFRGDGERGYVIDGVLSTSQFISLCMASASLIAIIVIRKRAMSQLAVTP
ncbi:MAG TPA: prolipoprotein diacylglyceryl transferase [Myxococcota bacterium]